MIARRAPAIDAAVPHAGAARVPAGAYVITSSLTGLMSRKCTVPSSLTAARTWPEGEDYACQGTEPKLLRLLLVRSCGLAEGGECV